jgi:hypothetical protein
VVVLPLSVGCRAPAAPVVLSDGVQQRHPAVRQAVRPTGLTLVRHLVLPLLLTRLLDLTSCHEERHLKPADQVTHHHPFAPHEVAAITRQSGEGGDLGANQGVSVVGANRDGPTVSTFRACPFLATPRTTTRSAPVVAGG